MKAHFCGTAIRMADGFGARINFGDQSTFLSAWDRANTAGSIIVRVTTQAGERFLAKVTGLGELSSDHCTVYTEPLSPRPKRQQSKPSHLGDEHFMGREQLEAL